jgi:hypothetical protein
MATTQGYEKEYAVLEEHIPALTKVVAQVVKTRMLDRTLERKGGDDKEGDVDVQMQQQPCSDQDAFVLIRNAACKLLEHTDDDGGSHNRDDSGSQG